MKVYKAISLLGLFGVVGNAYSVQMTPQIQKLLDQKAQKVAELEKCDKNRKGFMIAGISTLGLTVVGIGGNIALANKNKKLDAELTTKKSELNTKRQELSSLQSQQLQAQLAQMAQISTVGQFGAKAQTDTVGTEANVDSNADVDINETDSVERIEFVVELQDDYGNVVGVADYVEIKCDDSNGTTENITANNNEGKYSINAAFDDAAQCTIYSPEFKTKTVTVGGLRETNLVVLNLSYEESWFVVWASGDNWNSLPANVTCKVNGQTIQLVPKGGHYNITGYDANVECTISSEGYQTKTVKVSELGRLGAVSLKKQKSPLELCIESRSTAEGKACCYLPDTVAKWEGGACVCQAENTEFKIENGVGKCVEKQTGPAPVQTTLDASIEGTGYCYKDIDRDGGYNGGCLKFNNMQPGDWGTVFPDYEVYGHAVCNNTNGSYGVASNDEQFESGGVKCWCKMTHPAVSRWVFLISYSSASDCADLCADGCGFAVQHSSDFRSGVFGSVQ